MTITSSHQFTAPGAGRRVRWGVLGTARIALAQVIPALQVSALGEVVAIGSRSPDAARAAARQLGIPRAHGSYRAVLEDDAIDAVYIPLPNHLHVPWSILALEAGKHVLCEKPVAMDAAEARQLLAAADAHPALRVMEAFMYRFHPRWQAVADLVRRGAIGDMGLVHTTFCYANRDPVNIRNRIDTGGGALMDIGCYGIAVARLLLGHGPLRVHGTMERDPAFGTDRLTHALLTFPTGTATFTCATQLAPEQHVTVTGSAGRIDVDWPFNPPGHGATRLLVTRDGATEAIDFAPCNQFTVQGDRFAEAVLSGGDVPVPLGDAVRNMTVIDAIRASAATGCAADVA